MNIVPWSAEGRAIPLLQRQRAERAACTRPALQPAVLWGGMSFVGLALRAPGIQARKGQPRAAEGGSTDGQGVVPQAQRGAAHLSLPHLSS